MTSSGPRSCSATWALPFKNPAFDSRLAKYLLSTVEDNEISTIASLYSQIALPLDEVVYGKGAKKSHPRKGGPIRAFGTESRCFTRHGRAHGRNSCRPMAN